MKSLNLFVLALSLAPAIAQAYPKLDEVVPSAGQPIKVYRDAENPNAFWYIPQSIEPWSRDGLYKSVLYETPNTLSFIFRGQASVEMDMLKKVAAANHTSVANFAPIAYDYSKDLTCQNIYAGDSNVNWLFPNMIGNYLEVVPVSLRAKTPDLVNEISYLVKNGGLACTVTVGFKAQNLAYHVKVTANMDSIYDRFEAAMHGEYFIFELDIHVLLEKLIRERVINIEVVEDASIPETDLDKQVRASMDAVQKAIIAELFTNALKIPNGPMEGRGKPFSLRLDYRHSEEHTRWFAKLRSDKIQVKDTQISLRLALE